MPLRGFRALEARFRDAEVARALVPTMREEADRLEFLLEENASVLTGELRDSFEVELKDSQDRILVEYTSTAPHAPFVIRGTRTQEANNFVDRAYVEWSEDAVKNIRQDIVRYIQNSVINNKQR